MLKPMDIHNKEFKRVMRGYDVEEVDEFLDEIIVDFEKMQRELDVLKTQISNYSENMNTYREKELSLNNVMLSAQRFADQLTVDAERKAAEIIANAEREAERIVGSTQEKYNQVLADYAMLANRYNDAKETLRDYFRTQLTILDQDEAGIATEQVAEYIKQAEQLPQAVAEAEKKAMAENEETKLNVKLKEIMENTMVSEPAAE
ncbi:MAG: DivIVA domain-containing protein [Peptococcaceae bacterium]|nr:DivIVA domain-containing protein [Peptococcaceae bacterium]MBO5115132.1 DivIVA domain-containing protein [Peptococcaceae bacterium]MBO5301357.1 DivIVA domain-containing protein [Peptococcaceae bacterium]MBO5366129.1 DivIVA domain-containing protein [Peptococcaceae bacterium]MBO5429404.1 DivIVA domain-containing protein [Peptococcaceae bacterium]